MIATGLQQASLPSSAALGSYGYGAAFRHWFGESKAVDADGNPLTVYHGTDAEFAVFRPGKSGTFGPGIYFAESANTVAECYGGSVIAVHLRLTNPWVISVDNESEAAYEEDVDHPGVEAILALPGGRALLDDFKRCSDDEMAGHFDERLQRTLLALGFDGVIATYPDGSKEYVAFSPSQVKSATCNCGDFDATNPDIYV